MTWLLDGNLLVALRIDTHVSHETAQAWFRKRRRDHFATCPR
jgi:predicted nucleic acid-binding protein